MERTPYSPDTLICAQHIPPPNLLILRPTILQQQFRLLHDLIRIQVPHTYRLRVPIDVVGFYDRVFMWTRRHAEFCLRVFLGDCREGALGEEFVHAARGSCPVAVVEVEAATLEDECADAVLGGIC